MQWKQRGKSPKRRRPKPSIRPHPTVMAILWLLANHLPPPVRLMELEEPQETIQVEIQEPGITFIELGNMALTSSYAHVHIPFPIEVLERRLHYIEAISKRMNVLEIPSGVPEKEKPTLQRRLAFLQHFIQHCLEELQGEMSEITASFFKTLSEDSEEGREKRQLIIGAIIAATAAGAAAGGATAAFTSTDLNKVVENEEGVLATTVGENLLKIHQNTRDVTTLNKTLALMEEELQNNFLARSRMTEFDQASLRATLMTGIVKDQFVSTANVIRQAHRGMLAVDALPITVWQTIFSELNERAVQEGFELSIKGPEELESLQTTTLIDPLKKIIHIIAHISLFRPGEHLSLFRYIEVPQQIPLQDDDGKPIFTMIAPEETLIGMSRDMTTFVQMTPDELDGCQRYQHRNIWFCEQQTRLKKSYATCLSSLYNNDAEMIDKLCQRTLTTQVSKVTRISNSKWVIFEAQNTSYHITCPNQETRREIISGHAIMTLGEGCEVASPSRAWSRPKFEKALSIMAHFSNVPLPSPDVWTFSETKPMVQDVVRKLLKTVGQKVPETQVRAFVEFNRKLEEAKNVSLTFHPWHNFLGWILNQFLPSVGIILPIIILAYLAIKFWPHLRRWIKPQDGDEIPPIQMSSVEERENLYDAEGEVPDQIGNHRWSQPPPPPEVSRQEINSIMEKLVGLRQDMANHQDLTKRLANRVETQKRDLRAVVDYRRLNQSLNMPHPSVAHLTGQPFREIEHHPTVNLNIRSVPTNPPASSAPGDSTVEATSSFPGGSSK